MTAWMLGSVGGFEIGHYGGRSLLDHDGPLAKSRRKLLAKGDRVFGGHTFAASVTMPAFVSGIFKVRFGLFMLGALVAGVGLSYFLGAEIARRIGSAGAKAILGVILVVCAGLLIRAGVARWRARRSAKQGEPGEAGEQAPVLVPPAVPVRQDGADHPQDREDEPDEAKHPVPLAEADDREGEQQH